MSELENVDINTETAEKDNAPENFYIDILSGNTETANPKKLLVQKVLRQLIDRYGFNRGEVLFVERALQWVKPGTGRVGILLPDGLLGNPGNEYIRWWILLHCEVMASVGLPIEPFKVTVKEYGLTPALPSLLVLRRRSQQDLNQTMHPDYKVFMAVADREGVDARGNPLFRRSPDGEKLVFDEEVIERLWHGNQVEILRTTRRDKKVHDELPIVAGKFWEFLETGEVME